VLLLSLIGVSSRHCRVVREVDDCGVVDGSWLWEFKVSFVWCFVRVLKFMSSCLWNL
jgi:hypothetical protein